jgi:hypothetical protein
LDHSWRETNGYDAHVTAKTVDGECYRQPVEDLIEIALKNGIGRDHDAAIAILSGSRAAKQAKRSGSSGPVLVSLQVRGLATAHRANPLTRCKWLFTLQTRHHDSLGYSLILLLRRASLSRFSSSGESFGRSVFKVSLLSLPVNLNGTW